jgi:RHS repeat-associated protein
MEELGENPGDGSTWHDYAGAAIRNDLRIDDEGAVTVLRAYTQGLGLIESTDVVGEERLWYHGDMLGTTRLMTDEAGAADHRLRFTAFGEPLPLPGYGDPPGAPPQLSTRYGFAGSWGYQHDALTSGTDAPADLLHVGYRWYSPSIGRFIQRDPIGLVGGLNAYTYVANSPTQVVDPSGLFPIPDRLTVTGVQTSLLAILNTGYRVSQHVVDKMNQSRITARQIANVLRTSIPWWDEVYDNEGYWSRGIWVVVERGNHICTVIPHHINPATRPDQYRPFIPY